MLVDERTGRRGAFVRLRGGRRNGAVGLSRNEGPSSRALGARWILPLLAVLLGVVVAKDAWPAGSAAPKLPLATIRLGDISTAVSLTGSLLPVQLQNVDFQIAGQLSEVDVKVGDHVTNGQVLARLDARSERLGLAQAQAALLVAQASLRAALTPATADQIAQLSNTLAIAQQAYSDAVASATATNAQDAATIAADQQQLNRDQQLLASMQAWLAASTGYQIDQQQLAADQASLTKDEQAYLADGCGDAQPPAVCATDLAAVRNDQAAVAADQQRLAADEAPVTAQTAKVAAGQAGLSADQSHQLSDQLAGQRRTDDTQAAVIRAKDQLQVGTRRNPSQVAKAQAAITAAQAQVAATRLSLDRTTLTAPMDGTVSSISGIAGDRVLFGAGSSPLIVLINQAALQLVASVPDGPAKLQLDQAATVTFAAIPGLTIPGRVRAVSSDSAPAGSRNLVTVVLNRTDPRLGPGTAATGRVDVGGVKHVLVVPNSAITRLGDAASVTIYRNGKEIVTPVLLGASGDQGTEVDSGLQEGDQVVLLG